MKNTLKKAGAVLLLVAMLFSAAPRPASAFLGFGDIVLDPGNLIQNTLTAVKSVTGCDVKECALDPLAWVVAKMAVQTMTKSMVNWINSGFNGSPSFVTDLDRYLSSLQDAAANTFVRALLSNPAINSPFQTVVGTLAQVNYLKSHAKNGFFLQNQYTLNQYTNDDKGFINGTTNNGGWQAWLALGQPQNNPYGAYYAAQSELDKQISKIQANAIKQLDWGGGFLSWCGDSTGGGGGASAGGACKTDDDCGGVLACIGGKCAVDASLDSQAGSCTNKDGSTGTIKTPGSVIQNQLNKTLGLSGDSLVTADEMSELVGALMSQLVSQVVGATGLSGVSQKSSSGASVLDLATDASQLSATTGSISAAFVSGIKSTQDQVNQYQSSWTTISTAADSALSSTLVTSCPDTTTSPTETKKQATAALAKATTASAALTALSAAANSATTTTAMTDLGTRYQALMASSTMPSATEIQYAVQQSADSGTTTPASLYTQMKHIANRCIY